MTLQYADEIIDKFIGQDASKFNSFSAPDLEGEFDQHKYWLINNFLSNVYRRNFKDKYRQLSINFINRAEVSFRYYSKARESTTNYISATSRLLGIAEPSLYYKAINEWEVVLLNLHMLFGIWKCMEVGDQAYEAGDGSPHERAAIIANRIKHVPGDIAENKYSEENLFAIWLQNDGIHSNGAKISYEEIAEILREIGTFANLIQDAKSFVEKTL